MAGIHVPVGVERLPGELTIPDDPQGKRPIAARRTCASTSSSSPAVSSIVDWLKQQPQTRTLAIGLFGASTGGGAALRTAAVRPAAIAAVVSRGGRPDLAGDALPKVTAPTLLVVGGDDTPVIAMNRDAMALMRGEVSLEIVPGATHLFEEPGALERVAALAAGWFSRYLVTVTQ